MEDMEEYVEELKGFIENPELIHKHKLPPRAYYIPPNSQCLNGEWNFSLYPYVAAALYDALNPSADLSKASNVTVPGHWQLQGFGAPMYTNIDYPFQVNPPYVPVNNPTGLYRKTFRLSEGPNRVYRVRFDGVDSACYAFLNGQFIGFSKGSRNPAEFEISRKLNLEGDNVLTVVVCQWCDGSYIEDQDQWWLSGIFRDVTIISYDPKGHIEDFEIETRAISHNIASLKLELGLLTTVSTAVQVRVTPKPNPGEPAAQAVVSQFAQAHARQSTMILAFDIRNPALWTAETPNLYDVEILLLDEETVIDKVTTHLGVRTVQVDGEVLLVNGKPIMFKGTNRHDDHPTKGRAISSEDVKHDLVTMKRHNINSVRCSHYPSHPSLYYWADVLGLYVVAEADLECHGFGSSRRGNSRPSDPNASASRTNPIIYHRSEDYTTNNPQWKQAYLDRAIQMVYRDRNHPCVVMWSLGNEAFFGSNHIAMYRWIKAKFPYWPVHYEQDHNDTTMDVYSRMYPGHGYVAQVGKDKNQKPFILCEYAHAMGNGPGGMDEYQELFYKFRRNQGGFIWEWANHGLVKPVPNGNGETYYAYGGDFDEPIHDGTFVMDGICDSEHNPTPGLIQAKGVFRPANFLFTRKSKDEVQIVVENLNTFTSFEGYYLRLTVEALPKGPFYNRQSEPLTSIDIYPPHFMRNSSVVTLPEYPKANYNLVVTASLRLANDTPWAKKDHEVAFGQYLVTDPPDDGSHKKPFRLKRIVWFKSQPAIKAASETRAPELRAHPQISTNETVLHYEIKAAGGYVVKFDKATGGISEMSKNGVPVALKGPELGFWRAPTDNDLGGDAKEWKGYQVHNLTTSTDYMTFEVCVDTDGGKALNEAQVQVHHWCAPPQLQWGIEAIVTYNLVSEYVANQYVLEINTQVDYNFKGYIPPTMPRLGLDFVLNDKLDKVTWVGKGPGETYPDSKTGAKIGLFSAPRSDLFYSYEVPQENGNRSEVQWVSISSGNDDSVSLTAQPLEDNGLINFNVQPYSQSELEQAGHPYELEKFEKRNHFRVDFRVHGLGTASCGPGVLDKYKLVPGTHEHGVKFILH